MSTSFKVDWFLPPPAISVTPSTWDFGTIAQGESDTKVFTITNTGLTPLIVGTIALANPTENDFTIINDNVSGTTLQTNASLTFTLKFQPTSEESKSTTFDIPSNDPDDNPFNISGTAVGGPPPVWTGATDSEWSSLQSTNGNHYLINVMSFESLGFVIPVLEDQNATSGVLFEIYNSSGVRVATRSFYPVGGVSNFPFSVRKLKDGTNRFVVLYQKNVNSTYPYNIYYYMVLCEVNSDSTITFGTPYNISGVLANKNGGSQRLFISGKYIITMHPAAEGADNMHVRSFYPSSSAGTSFQIGSTYTLTNFLTDSEYRKYGAYNTGIPLESGNSTQSGNGMIRIPIRNAKISLYKYVDLGFSSNILSSVSVSSDVVHSLLQSIYNYHIFSVSATKSIIIGDNSYPMYSYISGVTPDIIFSSNITIGTGYANFLSVCQTGNTNTPNRCIVFTKEYYQGSGNTHLRGFEFLYNDATNTISTRNIVQFRDSGHQYGGSEDRVRELGVGYFGNDKCMLVCQENDDLAYKSFKIINLGSY